MSDEKKKLSLTALDIAILLAIIAIIASAVLRITWRKLNSSDTAQCSVSYKVSMVYHTVPDSFAEGEKVYLDDGSLLGTMGTSSVIPAEFAAAEKNGDITYHMYPEDTFSDISGTISAQLYKADGGYVTVGGIHIATGTVLTVHTRIADMTVLVTGVTPVK